MESNSTILALLFVVSIFYLTASSLICDKLPNFPNNPNNPKCDKELAYAIAVAAVSLLVSGVLMLGTHMSKLPEKSHIVGSLFMLAWWAAGCGVGTFERPFTLPSNGYFSAWIAFIASAIYAVNNVEFLKMRADSTKGLGSESFCLLVLFVSNVMFLTAAGIACDSSNCTDYVAYAVSVGAVGLLICIIFYAQSYLNNLFGYGKFVAGFNALWWGFGASITTFEGPFTLVGNGYFAAWISFFAAGCLFCVMAPEVAEKFGAESKADKAAEEPKDKKKNNDATPGDV